MTALARQFFTYALFGGLSTLVYWAVFWVLNAPVGMDYRPAVAIGYALGGVTNYGLQKFITFRDGSTEHGKQVGLYVLAVGSSLALSLVLTIAQVEWLGLPEMLAVVVTTGLVLVYNYATQKFIVFRGAAPGAPPEVP